MPSLDSSQISVITDSGKVISFPDSTTYNAWASSMNWSGYTRVDSVFNTVKWTSTDTIIDVPASTAEVVDNTITELKTPAEAGLQSVQITSSDVTAVAQDIFDTVSPSVSSILDSSIANKQTASKVKKIADWRVKLRLAPGAKYLYNADSPGILAPLKKTGGVVFPYTPQISVAYSASYDSTELTHSNYKAFMYRGSAVDSIMLSCEFTAQDTAEANYMLAVVHFFKSVTKMFYGQDSKPYLGTPPPLCYLTGLGAFQFDNHPLAVTSFNYALPGDVDYVRASSTVQSEEKASASNSVFDRLPSNVLPGGLKPPPSWKTSSANNDTPTYMPTKLQISITAIPITSRNDVSNEFSLGKYATGALQQGSKRNGKGIW